VARLREANRRLRAQRRPGPAAGGAGGDQGPGEGCPGPVGAARPRRAPPAAAVEVPSSRAAAAGPGALDASGMSVDGHEASATEREVAEVVQRVAERMEAAWGADADLLGSAGLPGGADAPALGAAAGDEGALRLRAESLERQLADVERGRVALIVREHEAQLRDEARERVRAFQRRLEGELQARVAGLLGERAGEVDACRRFRHDLEHEMETPRGILDVRAAPFPPPAP